MELPLREIGRKTSEILLNNLENMNSEDAEVSSDNVLEPAKEKTSDKTELHENVEVIKVPCRMIVRDSIARL